MVFDNGKFTFKVLVTRYNEGYFEGTVTDKGSSTHAVGKHCQSWVTNKFKPQKQEEFKPGDIVEYSNGEIIAAVIELIPHNRKFKGLILKSKLYGWESGKTEIFVQSPFSLLKGLLEVG